MAAAEEISMIARKLAVFVILGTTSLCWSGALARSPYDGSWSVAVYGQTGACQGGFYQLSVQIVSSHHPGRAPTHGLVSGQASNA
jgi:hypothetical protein